MPRWNARVGGHGWSWKKNGIWELWVESTTKPPWISQDAIEHGKASGATLEWDLRQQPHLWPAARLWLWVVAGKKDPREQELFPLDFERPEAHLDESLDLGQVRVVKMTADVVDKYAEIEKAFVFRLYFQFGIDVHQVLHGTPDQQPLHRRRLLAAMSELNPPHITCAHAEDEELGEPGSGEQELIPAKSVIEQVAEEMAAKDDGLGLKSITYSKRDSSGRVVSSRSIKFGEKAPEPPKTETAQEALDHANAEFGDGTIASVTIKRVYDDGTEEILDQAGTDPDDDDDDDDQSAVQNATPPVKVAAPAPSTAKAKGRTDEEATRLLESFLCDTTGKPLSSVVMRIQFPEERIRKLVKQSGGMFDLYPHEEGVEMCRMRNLAELPRFDDPSNEVERLEAARTDVTRVAAYVLANEPNKTTTLSNLCERVAKNMRQGDLTYMLARGLEDRPEQFRIETTQVGFKPRDVKMVTLLCDPNTIVKLPVNKPAAPAPAIDEGSMYDKVVRNLRDRVGNAAVYMVAQSIGATNEEVLAVAKDKPDQFRVDTAAGSPARITLLHGPSSDEMGLFIAQQLEVEPKRRLSKAELARRIAKQWQLRLSAAEAWLVRGLGYQRDGQAVFVDQAGKGIALTADVGFAAQAE